MEYPHEVPGKVVMGRQYPLHPAPPDLDSHSSSEPGRFRSREPKYQLHQTIHSASHNSHWSWKRATPQFAEAYAVKTRLIPTLEAFQRRPTASNRIRWCHRSRRAGPVGHFEWGQSLPASPIVPREATPAAAVSVCLARSWVDSSEFIRTNTHAGILWIASRLAHCDGSRWIPSVQTLFSTS